MTPVWIAAMFVALLILGILVIMTHNDDDSPEPVVPAASTRASTP